MHIAACRTLHISMYHIVVYTGLCQRTSNRQCHVQLLCGTDPSQKKKWKVMSYVLLTSTTPWHGDEYVLQAAWLGSSQVAEAGVST